MKPPLFLKKICGWRFTDCDSVPTATANDPDRVRLEEKKWVEYIASLQANTVPLSKALQEKAQQIHIKDIPRDFICPLQRDIMRFVLVWISLD